MTRFFITGTDTDVGKTVTAAILTLALRACYWKPIQSGLPDLESVKTLTALPITHFVPANYTFSAALSPDQAALLENQVIDLAQCVLPNTSKPLIVEGAGGVYTPLNANATMMHLMQQLNLPIIVVSRGTLGTINHTLLTVNALAHAGLKVHGVIFSGELNPLNQLAIEKHANVRTLLHIPFFNSLTPATLQNWAHQNQNKIVEALV